MHNRLRSAALGVLRQDVRVLTIFEAAMLKSTHRKVINTDQGRDALGHLIVPDFNK